MATEKHNTVIIVYKFQSIPDFSDCIAHAIPLIKKERPLYHTVDKIKIFLLFLRSLIFLSLIITIIEEMRNATTRMRAIGPKPKRDLTPIIIAQREFHIRVIGANIIQVNTDISIKEAFFIIFSFE